MEIEDVFKTTMYRNFIRYAAGKAMFCLRCEVLLDADDTTTVGVDGSEAVLCGRCGELALNDQGVDAGGSAWGDTTVEIDGTTRKVSFVRGAFLRGEGLRYKVTATAEGAYTRARHPLTAECVLRARSGADARRLAFEYIRHRMLADLHPDTKPGTVVTTVVSRWDAASNAWKVVKIPKRRRD